VAANAAQSVQYNVDMEAFWQYSHLLSENQNRCSCTLLAGLADRLDSNPGMVRTSAQEKVYEEVLHKD
jgi:hypothetical protein